MEMLMVGLGGALGSITRLVLGSFIKRKINRQFPIGTFIINVTGTFLLGAVSKLEIAYDLNLFIAYGFLGAFTTFSTFMFEGVNLIKQNKALKSAIYVSASLVIGIISFIAGAQVSSVVR